MAEKVEALDERTLKILKIRELVEKREQARQDANFTLADSIRGEVSELGAEIKDQLGGPSGWKFLDGSSKKLPSGYKAPPVPKAEKSEGSRKRGREDSDAPKDREVKSKGSNEGKAKVSNGEAKSVSSKVSEKVEVKSKPIGKEQARNKATLDSLLGKTAGVRNVEGVLIEDVVVGKGRAAQTGDRVKMNYVGRLKSTNKIFDSSSKKPFVFRLGKGEVIRGWDVGCVGMCIGGKRTLTIPPQKAYGKGGAPPTIPGNATLIFEVSLVEILL